MHLLSMPCSFLRLIWKEEVRGSQPCVSNGKAASWGQASNPATKNRNRKGATSVSLSPKVQFIEQKEGTIQTKAIVNR